MAAVRFELKQKRQNADSGSTGAGQSGAKAELGTMEQDAQVFAIYFEFGAELLAVGFVEEEALENPAVFVGEFGEHLADGGLALLGDERGVEVDADVGEVGELFFGGGVLLLAAQGFEHDIFRNGVDEGGQTFNLGAAANVDENAEERFLADVVDHLAGAKLEAETSLEYVREVVHEVSFRVWFLILQAGQILQVERRLFHRRPGSIHGTSRPGKNVQGS
jgi:hypothetical protein